MKEFTIQISQDIHKGLSPTARVRRNVEHATAAINVKAGQPYMEMPVFPLLATNISPTITHPFPQILDSRRTPFYLTAGTVGKINIGTGTVTPITTYNAFSPNSVRALGGGGVWHLADFDDTYFLFNGNDMVFVDGRTKYVTGIPANVLTQNDIKISTGTSHRGRIVMGGFTPTSWWTTAWNTLMSGWSVSGLNLSFPINEIGTNWVMWSSIGGFDFPLALIYPELITTGHVMGPSGVYTGGTLRESMFIDLMKRNEFGWMPMHWSGTILCVKSLGPNVAVYGDNGISMLMQSNGNMQQDVPPTFGLMDLSRVGVMNRGCVAGDEKMHVFLGSDYRLYTLNEEGIERLDYQQYMEKLNAPTTVVMYDQAEDQYFISDGILTYLLSNAGLTQVTIRPTSIMSNKTNAYSIFPSITNVKAYIETHPFDMSIRGIKTITSVNLGMVSEDPVYVTIKARYGPEQNWITGPRVRVNKEGNTSVRVAGVDFIICVEADDYETFQLDTIQVKWQASDKRTIRGQYANQDVT